MDKGNEVEIRAEITRRDNKDVICIITKGEDFEENGESVSDYIFYSGKVANVGELEEVCDRINDPEWTEKSIKGKEECFIDGVMLERNRIVDLIDGMIKEKLGKNKDGFIWNNLGALEELKQRISQKEGE